MQNAERGSEQNAKPRAQVVGRSLDPVVGRCGDCRYWGGSQFECKTADCFHPKAVEQRKCGRVTLSRSHSSRCQAFASDTPMMPQPPEETQEVRQLGNTDVFECLGVDGYNYGMLAVVRRPIGSTARPECVRGRWYWTPNTVITETSKQRGLS